MVQMGKAVCEPMRSHAQRVVGAWGAALALILGLSACGGSAAGSAQSKEEATAQASSSDTTVQPDRTLVSGAALSRAELAAAEQAAVAADASGSATPLDELKPGQTAAKSAYVSGAVARKAAAVRIPAYRFYNTRTAAHFYTTSEAEKASIQSNLPYFHYDGPAFYGASGFTPGLSAVYRFYNTQTGVHFYTISESEKTSILANLPQYSLDGVAYYASQVAGAGLEPLYRFYVPSKGFHFYTASEAEKNSIIANLAATYSFEGPAYYVLASDWKALKVPHTGVTDQQCYQSGSDSLVACSSTQTQTLNAKQDGHLTAVNPMSYSAVGAYPTSLCVKDNVTGLVWEAKTSDGSPQDKDKLYTKLNNGLDTDAYTYIAAINAVQLCGFSDWRLPTRNELQTLVDYGSAAAPRVAWGGLLTGAGKYWTSSTIYDNPNSSYYVGFDYGVSYNLGNDYALRVRLVHGAAQTGARSIIGTVIYSGDATNNAVSDVRSGLQWRRCEEGRVWNGSACTGTVSYFTHEQALAHAKTKSGWRLPNVKELTSLTELSASPAALDPAGFSADQSGAFWTSTPQTLTSSSPLWGWAVLSNGGLVVNSVRTETFAVRLVRDFP